jgi:hypothetical protein
MSMTRRSSVVGLTIWCLLSLWLCFGSLELAEQLNVVPETAVEDQEGQDADEEVLSQLASALKPDFSSLNISCCAIAAIDVVDSSVSASVHGDYRFQRLVAPNPSSLRLHQRLSVYRI